MLEEPGPIVCPCAYDCVSARVVELAGFPAVMHGGFNTAASLLGLADVGTITQTEMLSAARNMAQTVDIPVMCDVDDGFGKARNVARTTTEAIRAGVAGMYMEDQVMPKRCPSLGGGGVVSAGVEIEGRVIDTVREADGVVWFRFEDLCGGPRGPGDYIELGR